MGLLHASMYQATIVLNPRETGINSEFQSEDKNSAIESKKIQKSVTTRTCPKSSGTLVTMG